MPDEKLARAIRSKTRREILQILCDVESMSVIHFREKLNISESTASRHLKLLYDLGFLEFKNEFPLKLYSLKIKEFKKFFQIYDEITQKL